MKSLLYSFLKVLNLTAKTQRPTRAILTSSQGRDSLMASRHDSVRVVFFSLFSPVTETTLEGR
jgi:hypothetical protein